MSGLNWDLDELVSKVMADLRKTSDDSAARASAALAHDFNLLNARQSNASESDVETNAVSAPADDSDVYQVTERVLVADVVKRLAQTTSCDRWAVLPNAVVTPSAKDELKKLGVRLVVKARQSSFSNSASNAGVSSRVTMSASNVSLDAQRVERKSAIEKASSVASSVRVLLATHLPKSERAPGSVREYLARNAETTEIRLDCLKETSNKIAEEVNKDKTLKVVLITHDAAIGSVWANRLSGVRAVVAFTFDQAKRDLAAANANVLIVDPRDVGPYPIRRIVDCFLH